jgi:hypothetical protein
LPPPPTPTYPAPVLEPVSIIACNVTFRWGWDRLLAEDEYFELRVGKEGVEAPANKGWIKEEEYTYPPGEAGRYRWEIAVCRGDPATRICEQLAVSEFNEDISVFELRGDCGSTGPTNTPTAAP